MIKAASKAEVGISAQTLSKMEPEDHLAANDLTINTVTVSEPSTSR
ncbi:hypothetical protein EV13_2706 [Prochlorococcus sp. MIT 0702]|nr:hypothetical protein EV12_2654 [Prochlorococcus sp. MIT 0701]KGG25932.1 hypothetical protein EV13_2706 [Prochlorococcus sp. MIT 0702]KGG30893.1 hypothetical protein EV14_2832 [Prochlorococcus sp. MIT 0703]